MNRQKNRSIIRIYIGKIYFTLKKYFYWHFSDNNFAKMLYEQVYPFQIFYHQTPLLRELRGVDMKFQHNKVDNLKIAINKLNGLIIEPGQVFSYWRLIGNPIKTKGYVDGVILHNGKVTIGTGGGLCQLSNLIYWMTLHTPLTVMERWRHSYDVFPDIKRKQPFGTGATCSFPYIDLQFKNNTKQPFQLILKISNSYLIGEWKSDKPLSFKYGVIEKDHHIKTEWWGAYTRNNRIFRKVMDIKTDKLLDTEFITENHAIMMYEPLIENKN